VFGSLWRCGLIHVYVRTPHEHDQHENRRDGRPKKFEPHGRSDLFRIPARSPTGLDREENNQRHNQKRKERTHAEEEIEQVIHAGCKGGCLFGEKLESSFHVFLISDDESKTCADQSKGSVTFSYWGAAPPPRRRGRQGACS